ncbi:MAG: sulfur carrier protein ThiS [Natronospirillum sp.]
MTKRPLIQVLINHQPYWVPPDATVDQALAELATPTAGIALALNQTVVPTSQWRQQVLQNGDQIHIFQAIAGG